MRMQQPGQAPHPALALEDMTGWGTCELPIHTVKNRIKITLKYPKRGEKGKEECVYVYVRVWGGCF